MSLLEIENRATISRATCGWKKPQLSLDVVRRYWRDVHSPAIARRAGVYDYRHFQFGAVTNQLFPPITAIDYDCPADQQLMWLSDVRYLDEPGLAAFGASPDTAVKAHLLADIELIVDRSTTYKSLGPNARTLLDRTACATPQGEPSDASYGLFLRQRSDEPAFRRHVQALAQSWAQIDGVLRLRLSLFDAPDMEAERKAGYPVKTHALAMQYQAWIDLVIADKTIGRELLSTTEAQDLAHHVSTLHCYPVARRYTFNYGGRPTVVGLRGYPVHDAIQGLGGRNQLEPSLLAWMYGASAGGGLIELDAT